MKKDLSESGTNEQHIPLGFECPPPLDASEECKYKINEWINATLSDSVDFAASAKYTKLLSLCKNYLPYSLDTISKSVKSDVQMKVFAMALLYNLARLEGYNPIALKLTVPNTDKNPHLELAAHLAGRIKASYIKNSAARSKIMMYYLLNNFSD